MRTECYPETAIAPVVTERLQAPRKRVKLPQVEPIIAPGWDGGICLDLPLPTSVNRIWRRGRWSTYLSPEYEKWMERADEALRLQTIERNWDPIPGWFNTALMLPDAKRGIADLDNRIKAALDWSAKAGIISDDKRNNMTILEWGPLPPTRVRIWLVPTENPA